MEDGSIVVGRSQDATAPSDSTDVAEESHDGRSSSAALDVADCTSGASPSPVPSGPSSHRAGTVGNAPPGTTPRMTPEAALRSALGLCDYLLRHWAGPGEIGDMPSVASTRDDVIAGLLACGAVDYDTPPRPTLLAEAHARLAALGAGHGSRCLGVLIWDHEDRGNGVARHRVEWSATVFARGSSESIIARGSGSGPGALLDRIADALAVYDTPDPEPDVLALGELPEVAT